MQYKFLLACMILLVSSISYSQFQYPPLSNKGRLVQQAGYTTITVDYERPAARQRKIFGGLVPWGSVWRTGAGHCTVIQLTTPVVINNTTLPAGAYSLLTIPGEDNWTIIFNKDTSLYGVWAYNEKKDALRFSVKPEVIKRYYESMTIEIDALPHDADMFIAWANTRVQFRVSTGTAALVDQKIQQFVEKKSTDWSHYSNAAFYYNGINQPLQSMNIIHEGIKIAGEQECHLTKARALEKEGKYPEAINEVKKEMDYIKQFVQKKGYDVGIALNGFEWYVKEMEQKITKDK